MKENRKSLQKNEGIRDTFIGIFERKGTKNGWKGRKEKTILLKNIVNTKGKQVADHLWFNFTKGFQKVNPKPGDIIIFDGRVKEYEKGYKGYRKDVFKPVEIDYHLSYPTKIAKLGKIRN